MLARPLPMCVFLLVLTRATWDAPSAQAQTMRDRISAWDSPQRVASEEVFSDRRRIFVHPPIARKNSDGHFTFQPNVVVNHASSPAIEPGSSTLGVVPVTMANRQSILEPMTGELPPPFGDLTELPAPERLPQPDMPSWTGEAETHPAWLSHIDFTGEEAYLAPWYEVGLYSMVKSVKQYLFDPCGPWGRLFGIHDPPSGDVGIGQAHLGNAPFFVDTTQPFGNVRARLHAGNDLTRPDQSEVFWANIGGKGPPLPEASVDFQEFRFLFETGGEDFSLGTELPIRIVDPVLNQNTAGFGDMSLTMKTRLINGKYWQLTQIFRTYMNTGSGSRGIGTGHVSMEPGILTRFKWSDITYLHNMLEFRFPIAGDPLAGGELIRYGFGVSHLWYDTDTIAIIPTLELVGLSFLRGTRTGIGGADLGVDGADAFIIHPGCRYVIDNDGDFGIFEFGVSSGINILDQGWYRSILTLEVRWSH